MSSSPVVTNPRLGRAGIPTVMLGTWKSPAAEMTTAVNAALSVGLRAFDTANDYDNESTIGAALAAAIASGVVKREELFIQSKLWNTNHRPEHVKPDLLATLADLQLTYVDCFVIHWPQASPSNGRLSLCKDGSRAAHKSENTMFPLEDDGTYCNDMASHFVDTWRAMEALVDEGLCRHIGLSNFNRSQVAEVLSIARIRPVVLQNESHPHLAELDLRAFCRIHDIQFQAYSPLLSPDRPWLISGSITSGPPPTGHELLDNPTIKAIAAKHSKSAAQVVLRWHVQLGGAVAVKSVRPERIRENLQIFDFELTAADMAAFADLNIGWRHLLWTETARHPDYPFKEQLPFGFTVGKAPTNTGKSGKA
jgi:diketogulonate reductase-like aldo/keto reductase